MRDTDTGTLLSIIEGYYPRETYAWGSESVRLAMLDSWGSILDGIPLELATWGLQQWVSAPGAKFPLPGDILSVIAERIMPLPSEHVAEQTARRCISKGISPNETYHPVIAHMLRRLPGWGKLGKMDIKTYNETMSKAYRESLGPAQRDTASNLCAIIEQITKEPGALAAITGGQNGGRHLLRQNAEFLSLDQ